MSSADFSISQQGISGLGRQEAARLADLLFQDGAANSAPGSAFRRMLERTDRQNTNVAAQKDRPSPPPSEEAASPGETTDDRPEAAEEPRRQPIPAAENTEQPQPQDSSENDQETVDEVAADVVPVEVQTVEPPPPRNFQAIPLGVEAATNPTAATEPESDAEIVPPAGFLRNGVAEEQPVGPQLPVEDETGEDVPERFILKFPTADAVEGAVENEEVVVNETEQTADTQPAADILLESSSVTVTTTDDLPVETADSPDQTDVTQTTDAKRREEARESKTATNEAEAGDDVVTLPFLSADQGAAGQGAAESATSPAASRATANEQTAADETTETKVERGSSPAETPTSKPVTTPTGAEAAGVARSDVTVLGSVEKPSAVQPLSLDAAHLDRLAQTIRQTVQGGKQLTVRLHPPELGALQIEIVSRADGILANLKVETAAAHKALTENLAQLREVLAQQGTPVDRIEVHIVKFGEAGNFSAGDQASAQADREPMDQQQSGEQRFGEAEHHEEQRTDQAEVEGGLKRPNVFRRGLMPMEHIDVEI